MLGVSLHLPPVPDAFLGVRGFSCNGFGGVKVLASGGVERDLFFCKARPLGKVHRQQGSKTRAHPYRGVDLIFVASFGKNDRLEDGDEGGRRREFV